MRRALLLLPLCLGLAACDSDSSDPTAVEAVATNPVSIKVGETWSYRGVRWSSMDGSAMERVRVFTQCTAAKDTVINGLAFVLIDQTVHAIDKDSVRTSSQRNAIHVDDTSVVVWDNGDLAYGAGLLPAGRAATTVDSLLYSAVFGDKFLMPLRFPLRKGETRVYDGTQSFARVMRYLGTETVTVPGGTVAALVLARENPLAAEQKASLWIGPKGLVRRISSDSTMSGAGFYIMRDTTEWLGNVALPADSLKVVK